MPLTRLDNLYSSKTGKYLYVSPDDFNATAIVKWLVSQHQSSCIVQDVKQNCRNFPNDLHIDTSLHFEKPSSTENKHTHDHWVPHSLEVTTLCT